ncbi:MAG: DUF222 domain-containing protein [Acidimicrobiales bacterium]
MFEDVRSAVARFDFTGRSRPEIVDLVAAAARLRAALDAFDVRAAAALESLGDRGSGPSTMFRSAGKSSQREADRRARRAAQLSDLPAATAALSQGEITAEHADVLGRAAAQTSPEAVERSDLLHLARQRPADLFANDARSWVASELRVADRDAAEARAQQQLRRARAMRGVTVFDDKDDEALSIIHGRLPRADGAELRAWLDARADQLYREDAGREGADPAGGARTAEQRRADALMEVVRSGDSGGGRTGAAAAPTPRHQLVVTATWDPATSRLGEGEIVGVGPVPDRFLEELACSSELVGMVFSTDGRPLWLGRSVRLATPAQWLALLVRDGGCIGCGADPSRCHAHHVVPWVPPKRGPTDIDNLALLCSHHHHLVHDHRWRLEWHDGRWNLLQPRRQALAR